MRRRFGCCGAGFSAYAATSTIEAPPDVVWNVIADVESTPQWNSFVLSVERIAMGDTDKVDDDEEKPGPSTELDWAVGTSWYENYRYQDLDILRRRTITEMSISEDCRTVKINVDYPSRNERSDSTIPDSATVTSTMTVYPIRQAGSNTIIPDRCQLVGTFAVIPAALQSKIYFALCGTCFKRDTTAIYQIELENCAEEAERRFKQRMGNKT